MEVKKIVPDFNIQSSTVPILWQRAHHIKKYKVHFLKKKTKEKSSKLLLHQYLHHHLEDLPSRFDDLRWECFLLDSCRSSV